MKLVFQTRTRFRPLLEEAFEKFRRTLHQYPREMNEDVQVRIAFSKKMRSVAGRANLKDLKIQLNYRLLAGHEDELIEVFVHELCHVLAPYIFGKLVPPHGQEWQSLMIGAGFPANRTHSLDTAHLEHKLNRHEAFCLCEDSHQITTHKLNLIERGVRVWCVECKADLRLYRHLVKKKFR